MNFRNRKEPALPEPTDNDTPPELKHGREHIVDLVKLQNHLDEKDDPLAYAQPERRAEAVEAAKDNLPDLATKVIQQFTAMPTEEIAHMLKAIKQEVAAIEADCDKMQTEWNSRAEDVMGRIRRLTSGCKLSKEAMGELWKQVKALDANGETKQPAPAEAPAT